MKGYWVNFGCKLTTWCYKGWSWGNMLGIKEIFEYTRRSYAYRSGAGWI